MLFCARPKPTHKIESGRGRTIKKKREKRERDRDGEGRRGQEGQQWPLTSLWIDKNKKRTKWGWVGTVSIRRRKEPLLHPGTSTALRRTLLASLPPPSYPLTPSPTPSPSFLLSRRRRSDDLPGLSLSSSLSSSLFFSLPLSSPMSHFQHQNHPD